MNKKLLDEANRLNEKLKKFYAVQDEIENTKDSAGQATQIRLWGFVESMQRLEWAFKLPEWPEFEKATREALEKIFYDNMVKAQLEFDELK